MNKISSILSHLAKRKVFCKPELIEVDLTDDLGAKGGTATEAARSPYLLFMIQ